MATKPSNNSLSTYPSVVTSFRNAGQGKYSEESKAAYAAWQARLSVWRSDRQYMDLPSPIEHLDATEFLKVEFLTKAADLLIQQGFGKPEERQDLIQRLIDLPLKKWDNIVELAIDENFIRPCDRESALFLLKELPIDCEYKEIARALTNSRLLLPYKFEDFVARIITLPEEPKLELDGAEFSWRIKSLSSAQKKLSEASINQDPGKIGDYFACKTIVKGKDNVIRSVNVLSGDPYKTSEKNLYEVPESYRCAMYHICVEKHGIVQTGEWQVVEESQERIAKFTHKLKDIGRSLTEASRSIVEALSYAPVHTNKDDRSTKSISTRLSNSATAIDAIRIYANDIVNQNTGMNDLAIPGYERYAADKKTLPSDYRSKAFIEQAERFSGITLKDLASGKGCHNPASYSRAFH